MRRHSDGNRHGTGHACVAMEPRDWLGGRGGGGGVGGRNGYIGRCLSGVRGVGNLCIYLIVFSW